MHRSRSPPGSRSDAWSAPTSHDGRSSRGSQRHIGMLDTADELPNHRRTATSQSVLGFMSTTHDFEKLLAFLERLPAIDLPAGRTAIGRGSFENGNWWIKFSLN